MYKILKKKELNPTVVLMEIDAPLVAKKAEPGQFIILRTDENGERIPRAEKIADASAPDVVCSTGFQTDPAPKSTAPAHQTREQDRKGKWLIPTC